MLSIVLTKGLRRSPVVEHDMTTRSPSGLSERRTGFSPPGARLADGPGCPPDRGRPMSGNKWLTGGQTMGAPGAVVHSQPSARWVTT